MPSRSLATVLVVEREPQVLRVLKEILGRAGFTVLPARSGQKALRLYEQHRSVVDLLLVDCMHPEVQQITSQNPELKVLGLAGAAEEEFAGKLTVVAKPFTPAALVQAVLAALGRADTRG
jgi:CheY-like chemotaxis protein